jgi:hypothetical protein
LKGKAAPFKDVAHNPAIAVVACVFTSNSEKGKVYLPRQGKRRF